VNAAAIRTPAFRVMMPGVRLLLSLTCDRLGDPQHPQLADLL
jgi:hypothetical protein